MTFGLLEGESRTFKGLGGAVALGRRRLTIGIESVGLDNITILDTGDLFSHEVATGENPLLLSLAAQQTLGLCKDVETGTCYSKQNGSFVQLYSVVGSSLRAIVIHDPEWKTRFPKSRTFGAPVQEAKEELSEEAKSLVLCGMQSEAFETAYDLAANQGQVTFCRGCNAIYLISDSYCWSCG